MKPIAGKNLPKNIVIYNKRISRARVLVENAFGHMCQKWRIFYSEIQLEPEKVDWIVKCACLLQNILIDLGEIKLKQFSPDDDINEILSPLQNEEEKEQVKKQNENLIEADNNEKIREYLITYFEKNPIKRNLKRKYPSN